MARKRKINEKQELEIVKNRWKMSNQDKMNCKAVDDYDIVETYLNMDIPLMYSNIKFPPDCPVTPSNKVLETRRLMASKMAPGFPEGSFGPVDDTDRPYSDMANAWLEWWEDYNKFPKLAKDIIEDALSVNDPAFEVIFDPYDNYPEGSIKLIIRQPTEYAWDPIGDQWCIIMDPIPKEQLVLMYPQHKDKIMRMPDIAMPSTGSGEGITSATHVFDKDYPKSKMASIHDEKTGYTRIFKMFEKCYDYETIDEDETIEAVTDEKKELLKYDFQGDEGGVIPVEQPSSLAFDETDDHPKHIELLSEWYLDWEKSKRAEMGSAAEGVIALVRPYYDEHINKHQRAIEYMTKAKLPIGKRVKYPGGKMVITLDNEELLDVTENPIGMFTLQPFSLLRYKNQRWGRPFLRFLVPMQERRDALVAQWSYLLKTAMPKWKRARRGTEEGGHIDNDPTRIIDCDDPQSEGWDSPNINYPDIIGLINQIDQDFQSFSNIFDAYRGAVPTGVKSGKGIEALSSMAETVTNLDTMSLEESAQKLFLIIWTMAVNYLPPSHFERVLGSEFEPQFWQEDIDLNKLADIPLDVRAEFKDPNKTNKLVQLTKLAELMNTPFGQYLSPRAVAHLIKKNAELNGMDEVEEIQDEYIAGIELQMQQAIAQQLAAIQIQQGMMGTGGQPETQGGTAVG